MATVYTNNIVENFQPRAVVYIQHKLDSFVPVRDVIKRKANNDYIYEWIAGGEPAELDIFAEAPLELILVIQEMKVLSMPLAPRPWTTKSMSATPGAFVPVLYAILQEYERKHVAAEYSLKPTSTLPKLFALTPIPKSNDVLYL
ncbi:hypothetical protein VTP01DRAFT_2679 [Rhizomucor pusillus]|uniref:uncharacterized protein n=1 Tax=Rhizomucor pusillus TaxID=4840 RepID=UPI003742FBC1